MIYLFTALYCEAAGLIRQFRLEKNLKNTRFQEFFHEAAGIRLTVTGCGEIAAAAAVGSVCTEYRPNEGDMLLNLGTCAYTAGGDGIFLCNKITEQATGKTFYPDMLYRHNFREEAVVTGMRPWNGEKTVAGALQHWNGEPERTGLDGADGGAALYDMEAAAVYQAGSYFFGPHQMVFLKVVSDAGAAGAVSKGQIERLLEACQERLFAFVEQLRVIACGNAQKEGGLSQEKKALAARLCADMHCSEAMENALRQCLRYLELAGTDYVSAIEGMYEEGLLPCKDRREGKLRFEELRSRLF